MNYLGIYNSFAQSFLQHPDVVWTVPVLFATLDDGSVWELRYGAKEWRELPPIPGSKRAQEKGEEGGAKP